MGGKRPRKTKTPVGTKDEQRQQARAQLERNLKKVMHRPAARVGETRHGRA
jgi:hypothetical protein